MGGIPAPTEVAAEPEIYLRYAADMMWEHHGHLREWRLKAIGVMKEIKVRCQKLTETLRAAQDKIVAEVTKDRDLGMLAPLCL